VVTGYLGFQDLFDWQFGHTAPDRYFLMTRPGLLNGDTPLYAWEENLATHLLVARLFNDNGSENAVALSNNAGPAGSIGAVISDPEHRISGITNTATGASAFMKLEGSPEDGIIKIEYANGNPAGASGTYQMVADPLPHLRLALPSRFQATEAKNGFQLGYPALAQMQGRVRLAWVLGPNTNTSYLFGGNGVNLEYGISGRLIQELSRAVPVSLAD
jgi:hypothetical protein